MRNKQENDKMTAKLLIPLVLLTAMGLPTKALAHVIETNYLLPESGTPTLESKRTGDTGIKFSSTYNTGEPFSNGKVTIWAPDNEDKPWLVSKMDENGEYEFKPDPSKTGDWTIDIGEGGHWDSWTIPVKAQGNSIIYGELSDASSTMPEVPSQLLIIGAACLSGGVGSLLLRARYRR
jgi:nickel transport protein